MIITFILGLFMTFVYFFEVPSSITNIENTFNGWATIIGALVAGIGIIVLLRYNIRRIQRRRGDWIYSIITVVSIFIFPVISLVYGMKSSTFNLWFTILNRNLGVAVYGIVLFALTGGVYRAFRVRNINSFLLILSCFLVMLQIAPIGEAIWSGFPSIGNWMLEIPNTGAFRGLMIASVFGTLAVAFRTLIGYERGYLGGLGEEEK